MLGHVQKVIANFSWCCFTQRFDVRVSTNNTLKYDQLERKAARSSSTPQNMIKRTLRRAGSAKRQFSSVQKLKLENSLLASTKTISPREIGDWCIYCSRLRRVRENKSTSNWTSFEQEKTRKALYASLLIERSVLSSLIRSRVQEYWEDCIQSAQLMFRTYWNNPELFWTTNIEKDYNEMVDKFFIPCYLSLRFFESQLNKNFEPTPLSSLFIPVIQRDGLTDEVKIDKPSAAISQSATSLENIRKTKKKVAKQTKLVSANTRGLYKICGMIGVAIIVVFLLWLASQGFEIIAMLVFFIMTCFAVWTDTSDGPNIGQGGSDDGF